MPEGHSVLVQGMLETGHLGALISGTSHFLDPEICNKIISPILITKT